MKLKAEWTDDCCGKKDYDGPVLAIHARYWPSGSGFMVFDSTKPELGLRDADDSSRPSVVCELRIIDADRIDDEILVEIEIEGDSFEEVAQKVEEWSQEQMDKAVTALKTAFHRESAD